MNEFILSNGLRILYYPISDAYSTSISLYVKAGSMYENAANNGITHFLEHIHFRQLGNMSQDEIYYKTECMGSTLKAITYKDSLRFYMKVRPNFLYDSLVFFKEILTSYQWTNTDFELEKKVILNQIFEKSTYMSIAPIVAKTVWKTHSLCLPIIGNEENIKKFTLQNLVEYKKDIFQTQNILLIITGYVSDTDITRINDLFSQLYITSLTPKLTNYHLSDLVQYTRKPDICFVNCTWDYLDVVISFDVDINAIQYDELILLNSILGGGNGSIMQKTIREKKGLSSNIYSYAEVYSDSAVLHISLSVNKKSLYECIKCIMALLKELKTNISERDFKTTIPFFMDNLWYWLEDPEIINFELGWQCFVRNSNFFTIEDKIELFSKISIERLIEISNLIFKPENTSLTLLGSVNKLTKKEIRKLVNDELMI